MVKLVVAAVLVNAVVFVEVIECNVTDVFDEIVVFVDIFALVMATVFVRGCFIFGRFYFFLLLYWMR